MAGGRQPLVEDELWLETIFGGRRPLVKDNFGGGQPLQDNLWLKTTIGGSRNDYV